MLILTLSPDQNRTGVILKLTSRVLSQPPLDSNEAQEREREHHEQCNDASTIPRLVRATVLARGQPVTPIRRNHDCPRTSRAMRQHVMAPTNRVRPRGSRLQRNPAPLCVFRGLLPAFRRRK